jgi:predicted molibdopterin-dependent oxidoreductase YjgC
LQPATWHEALDLIAHRFREIIEQHGPEGIAGLGSPRVTNEANYLFQRFMRAVVGTNNVDHLGRVPSGAVPLSSLPDLEQKDVILLLGFDPSTEAPLVELWIKKAVLRRGARVLIANPRRIELGRYGGPWLGYRPGSEVALLNGLARAILDAGPADETTRVTKTRVTNMDEFRKWLKEFAPRQVDRMTGVPADDLQHVAELLAQARHPIILYGPHWVQGLGLSGRGLDALANLALVLGGIEAGFVAENNNSWGALEMGVLPNCYPGGQSFKDNQIRNRLAGFWGSKLSPVEGFGFDGMMLAGREGDLQAMWIMGADPAYDCRVAGDALGRIPFLVVQDLFMTEAASLAEVVLPAASFAETDGSYTNLTGRLQAVRAGMRPPGQARPDWWIIVQLARRMVDSKRQRAWDFSRPADVLSEIARVVPGYRGVDYARMKDIGWQPPVKQPAARRAFVRAELDVTPRDPEYPLALVTGRLLYDRGMLLRLSEPTQNLVPEAFIMIHPSDAEELGLSDGDSVSVISPQGRLRFSLKVGEEIVPGAAFAPANLSDAPLSVLLADRWALPYVRIVK